MIISDQEVQAFVDGELAPEDAARVEAAIAADVLVAARVERERRLRAQVRGAFDPALAEPVPSRFTALLDEARATRPASNVVRLEDREPSAAPRTSRWRAPVMALAASVAALAIAGWLRSPAGNVDVQGDALLARGELADALDTGLAAAPDPEAPVAIGLTFRAAGGEVCRTVVAHRTGLAGLACRGDGRWRLEAVSTAADAPGGELRQAAAATPAEIQAAVDARMEGDAFDAAQERAAQANGWR